MLASKTREKTGERSFDMDRDQRILDLARCGRVAEAADMLVRAYGGEIVGTCVGRMGDPMSGEDAAQDTLARALVALPGYRGNAGLRPWLHRIAANRCIDLMRSGGMFLQYLHYYPMQQSLPTRGRTSRR